MKSNTVENQHTDNCHTCEKKEINKLIPDLVTIADIDDWLEIAVEVEHLFGPMVSDENFHNAIKLVINENRAFCIRSNSVGKDPNVCGIIVISFEDNEIQWFAVAHKCRNKGYGQILLRHALSKLDLNKPVSVQTFDEECTAGLGARQLYSKVGFIETEKAGLNPAGISTVIMKLLPKTTL